jgi:competence protein ComEC
MNNYPVIKLTLLFITGILIQHYLKLPAAEYLIGSAGLTLLLILALLIFHKKIFNISLQIILIPFIISFGTFIYSINDQNEKFLPEDLYKLKNIEAIGRIVKIDLHREYEIRFEIETDSIIINNSVIKEKYKLLCRVRDNKSKLDSLYQIINPGNQISLLGTYTKGRDKRNPGEFDYNIYLQSIGISGLLTSYDASSLKILNNNNDLFKTSILNIRKYLDDEISKLHKKETAGLLKGLLLADRSEIEFETKTEFINSGVVHVLAVSGLHTGFIIVIFVVIFGRFNIYVKSLITITGLIFFLIVTGMPPSVFRASLMAIIIIIALLTNRSTNLFNSLAIAALILLLINPKELFNPGFQLSFSAVAAIAAIYIPAQKRLNKIYFEKKYLKNIILFLLVSLAAQIGTLPFTLAYFGKLSVIALLANLIVIPMIGVIVGLGITTVLLNILEPGLAALYAAANDLIIEVLFLAVHFAGSSDYSYLTVRNFSLYDSVLFYLLIIPMFYYLYRVKNILPKILLIFLIAINYFVLASFDDKELLSKDSLDIIAIDVGQGDAILIKFPNNQTALIDAGDANSFIDNGERVILPLLNYLNIDKIDYGFISHLDADHYGGFIHLILENKIAHIIKPPADTSNKDIRLEKFLSEMNIPVSYYKKDKIDIGNVRIYMLNDSGDPIYSTLSTNDKSGVLKLVYGNTSFLFTGDVEKKAEKYYSSYYKDFLKTDVLKVAHHGSTTSSSPEFIYYAWPDISIISAGIQNKFNHPSSIILNRLNAAGSKIFRTDLNGAIFMRSDGDAISIMDWKNH